MTENNILYLNLCNLRIYLILFKILKCVAPFSDKEEVFNQFLCPGLKFHFARELVPKNIKSEEKSDYIKNVIKLLFFEK